MNWRKLQESGAICMVAPSPDSYSAQALEKPGAIWQCQIKALGDTQDVAIQVAWLGSRVLIGVIG